MNAKPPSKLDPEAEKGGAHRAGHAGSSGTNVSGTWPLHDAAPPAERTSSEVPIHASESRITQTRIHGDGADEVNAGDDLPLDDAPPKLSPREVFCAQMLLTAAQRRGEPNLRSTFLLSYIFKARTNTIDQSFRRGCRELGITETMRQPMKLLQRAGRLGMFDNEACVQTARRLLDAWKAETASENWVRRIERAAAADKRATVALRTMNKRWKRFVDTLTSTAGPERPWAPDVKSMIARAESLGLTWAHIPKEQGKLDVKKVLDKVERPFNNNRFAIWKDFLERSAAQPQASSSLDAYVEATQEYARCCRVRDSMMAPILTTSPSTDEFQGCLNEFARMVEQARERLGRDVQQ